MLAAFACAVAHDSSLHSDKKLVKGMPPVSKRKSKTRVDLVPVKFFYGGHQVGKAVHVCSPLVPVSRCLTSGSVGLYNKMMRDTPPVIDDEPLSLRKGGYLPL